MWSRSEWWETLTSIQTFRGAYTTAYICNTYTYTHVNLFTYRCKYKSIFRAVVCRYSFYFCHNNLCVQRCLMLLLLLLMFFFRPDHFLQNTRFEVQSHRCRICLRSGHPSVRLTIKKISKERGWGSAKRLTLSQLRW